MWKSTMCLKKNPCPSKSIGIHINTGYESYTVTKLSKSPERHTFQRDGYIARCKEEGKEPDPSIVQIYTRWAEEPEFENRPENDLEYDLRTTDWILEKARTREEYAQNIYAALCNIRWQKKELFPILGEQFWSCSWRKAGGIVADILQKGDYIDWYCSGMGGLNQEYNGDETNEEWQARTGYVSEGVVTDEIKEDFGKIKWMPSEWPEDKA